MSEYTITWLQKRTVPLPEDVPVVRYEGPFGPAELLYGPGVHITRVRGPGIPELEIDFGLHGRPYGGTSLRDPVSCRLGDRSGHLRHPGFALLSRRKRALHLDFGDRHYRYLLAGFPACPALERDGRRLAGGRRVRGIADWADPADIPVLLLLRCGPSSFQEAIKSGFF